MRTLLYVVLAFSWSQVIVVLAAVLFRCGLVLWDWLEQRRAREKAEEDDDSPSVQALDQLTDLAIFYTLSKQEPGKGDHAEGVAAVLKLVYGKETKMPDLTPEQLAEHLLKAATVYAWNYIREEAIVRGVVTEGDENEIA